GIRGKLVTGVQTCALPIWSSTVVGSTSVALTQTVNLVGTSTAVTSSLNPSTVGQSVTFTATISRPSGTPSGTVTFKDGGTTLGKIGRASCRERVEVRVEAR